MKKVTGIAILKRIKNSESWELKLPDEKRIISECLEQWHKTENAQAIELSFEIKSKFQFKSGSQLGYIHAAIYPTIIRSFRDWGNESPESKLIELLKDQNDFTEVVPDLDGCPRRIVKSLSTASKEEVSDFIDRLIRWAGEWAIKIETPEEYMKRLGIRKLK